jgi:hypothetical protein
LIPLAVTSTHAMMRRLGRRWSQLHRLIYPIAALGVWHYYWQEKRDVREPLLYAAVLALLLGYRAVRAWRQRHPPRRRLEETRAWIPIPGSSLRPRSTTGPGRASCCSRAEVKPEYFHGSLRQEGAEQGETGDARAQAGHAAQWSLRTQGQESQAGDRDRSFRGTKVGR